MKKKAFSLMATALVGAQCLAPLTTLAAAQQANEYQDRFQTMYNKIKTSQKDGKSAYFSADGVPYHSIETIQAEAPDQGHESTSEAASYYVWLEAVNGKFTGDYSGVADAWEVIDKYFIPTSQDQPGQSTYNPSSPATFANEYPEPDYYPSQLKFGTPVGQDPIYYELKNTYGTSEIYGMHWLIDCDNFYGFGTRGDGKTTPSYINTFQRGEQESTFETIPQPSWEAFNWGGSNGYLPFFTGDNSYSRQWRYTNAPDADARVVQAMYWAKEWAKESGANVSTYTDKAAKMGDYLRYAMFDKYFIKQGAQAQTAAQGYDSADYLLNWYYAWGGGIGANWSWRIGCSHAHFGYQNPMAAWILSNAETGITPKSQNGARDWGNILDRELEFYQWLQSSEGAIAGGATNSWNGQYQKYPSGTSTFHGMAYTEHPVYHDPGSNRWFGMQAWSMQRVAELYYVTGDERAAKLLDKWAEWVLPYIHVNADSFEIPSNLGWSGQPDTWTGTYTGNPNLHVTVDTYGQDLGIAGSLANTLFYYAAAKGIYQGESSDYKVYAQKAQDLIDCIWDNYTDEYGISATETRSDYVRFFTQEVYVPANYTGKMPNGDEIKPGCTFLDIRSNYKNDENYDKLVAAYENYKQTGEFNFEINYHRFWAQCDYAIANGVFAILFPEGVDGSITKPNTAAEPTVAPTVAPTTTPTSTPTTPTSTPTPTPTPTSTSTPIDPSGKVSVSVNTNANGNSISQVYNISANETVDLADVKVRCYFDANGLNNPQFWCDNAGLQLNVAPWYVNYTSAVNATFGQDAKGQYIELSFNQSQTLQPGTGSLSVQVRFANSDWSNIGNFQQTELVF